jgi:hypothetical protein
VTGTIKNNTATAYSDIVLTLSVKTGTLGKTGTVQVTVPSLAAGREYAVNATVATTENFEQVTDVTATAGGAALPLHASQTAPKTPAEVNGAAVTVGCLAVAGLILVVAVWRRRAKQKAEAEQALRVSGARLGQARAAYANFTQSAAQSAAGDAEARKMEAAAEIERARLESKRLERERSHPVYCTYCGAKNAQADRVCSQCGAKMN